MGIGFVFLAVAVILAVLALPKKAYSSPSEAPGGPISLDSIIESTSREYGVEAALIRAVIKVESNFNPYAKNPSDPSYGLMQIMPILAADDGYIKDWANPTEGEIAFIMNPSINVKIGTAFLSKLLKKYPLETAVQMYNVGEAGYNVKGARNTAYLKKVMEAYDEFRA